RGGAYARLWEKQTGLVVAPGTGAAALKPAGLRRVQLLERLDPAQLEALAPKLVAESFARDRLIVREGDPGDKLYILVRGRVEITRASAQGERRIAVLDDGDYFGEMALLDGAPRGASARALSFCTCLSLARADFLDLLEQHPALRAEVSADSQRRRSEAAQGA
ncbi:MAG TPA: cyclic nucleotide-binding domain-containing protein, partial [Solimonas sp.]|nr:cyclic nucleotide-binding domain-containing protein [Solimonas sp.]